MGQNKEKERINYINMNKLQDSYIDKNIIYQYRKVVPQRIYIGKSKNYDIFFEETRGSLLKRNYGKAGNVTSWNLLYSDGKKSEKITKENIKDFDFVFKNNYSIDDINNYLKNNSKRMNGLNPVKTDRKTRQIWVNDEEFLIVQEFVKKLRGER